MPDVVFTPTTSEKTMSLLAGVIEDGRRVVPPRGLGAAIQVKPLDGTWECRLGSRSVIIGTAAGAGELSLTWRTDRDRARHEIVEVSTYADFGRIAGNLLRWLCEDDFQPETPSI